MSQDSWALVDRYITETVLHSDAALEQALVTSAAAGLPDIQVTPAQGQMLQLLALAVSARRILEIGTLGGYSAIWLGRALPPDGQLVTLEVDPRHAMVARENIARAHLTDVVDLRIGPALEILAELCASDAAPFDLIFIDADKANIPKYFEWSLRLARQGSLIVVDNVVRKGELANAASIDASVVGVRQFAVAAGAERRVTATIIQTVGAKGHDGFALVRVTEPWPRR